MNNEKGYLEGMKQVDLRGAELHAAFESMLVGLRCARTRLSMAKLLHRRLDSLGQSQDLLPVEELLAKIGRMITRQCVALLPAQNTAVPYEWLQRYCDLLERYPAANEETVRQALIAHNGNAGAATADLIVHEAGTEYRAYSGVYSGGGFGEKGASKRCPRCNTSSKPRQKQLNRGCRHNGDACGSYVRQCMTCGFWCSYSFDEADDY
jgi:hypothetical protein